MLYDSKLDTFIKVAKTGSFSAAAKDLYVSVAAVSQQMANLENQLNTKLFSRTHHGIVLTDQGKILLNGAKKIIADSTKTIDQLSKIGKTLTVATGMFFEPVIFNKAWEKLKPKFSDVNIKFSEIRANSFDVQASRIDLIEAVQSNTIAKSDLLFKPIDQVKLQLATPPKNKLLELDKIKYSDLKNVKVAFIYKGYLAATDNFRNQLFKLCPEIKIVDTDSYDYNFINNCLIDNIAVIIPDVWSDQYRGFEIKDFATPFKVNYGFYYHKNASKLVKNFLEAFDDKRVS